MSTLHFRMATIDDAPQLAQLAFDVMEQNPLNNSYTVKSRYSPVKKQIREIGDSPAQYNEFLQHEIGATRRDIKNMHDDGRMMCVAYEENAPETLLGAATTSLVKHDANDDVALVSSKQTDCVIEKFFAARDVRHTGAFMLNAIKDGMKKIGVQAIHVKAAFGVHHFFTDNGFKMVSQHPSPVDNRMVCDLYSTNSGFGRPKPTLRIFPINSAGCPPAS